MDVKVVAELLHELNGKSHEDLLNTMATQIFNQMAQAHNQLVERVADLDKTNQAFAARLSEVDAKVSRLQVAPEECAQPENCCEVSPCERLEDDSP